MAIDLSSRAFLLRRLLFTTLLAFSARAEPELSCPDYVGSYAPLVWLHSDDPFMPSDLLTHIGHTTPMLDGQPIRDLPSLNLDNLEILNNYGDQVALTANEDPTTYPAWLFGEAPDASGRVHNATPCVVIVVEKDQLVVDAFYFYFYSYDEGPNITQVLEPLDRLAGSGKAASGIPFGNHIGDWEHNMVRFRDGKPEGIYFSQHMSGTAYDWEDPMISRIDGRPVVYSARGSHANYPASGGQIHDAALIDYCDEGQKWDPILSAYFYHFNPDTFTLTSLFPPHQSSAPSPSPNLTSFFYFTGRWGDLQYPDSDPRQETVPYFGIKRFLDGPTGPRHKHLVRKGLIPDGRGGEGWMSPSLVEYAMALGCLTEELLALVIGNLEHSQDPDVTKPSKQRDLLSACQVCPNGFKRWNEALNSDTIRAVARRVVFHSSSPDPMNDRDYDVWEAWE
ncbi:Fc.00g116220.m01.CDS01, partial [Cosmosporella sp. VM-42]